MSKEKDNVINVVIETPKGSRNKYAYDKELKAFRLKKLLPVGVMFPFDFGYIPNTKGEDGDPIDILVIMDEAAYPGCVVECRLIGALKAKQSKGKDDMIENDRLIAVSTLSQIYQDVKELEDLNKNVLRQIESFFVYYNTLEDKEFKPKGWGNAKEARHLIKEAK